MKNSADTEASESRLLPEVLGMREVGIDHFASTDSADTVADTVDTRIETAIVDVLSLQC